MSSNNQPPFYVGQKVVALVSFDHHTAPLIKGQVYTVLCICQCPDCGKYSVGISAENVPYSHWTCCYTRNPSTDHWVYDADKFAPINPYSNSVSKELAEQALSVGDSVDQPVKKLVNN